MTDAKTISDQKTSTDHPQSQAPTTTPGRDPMESRRPWAWAVLLALGAVAAAAGSEVIFRTREVVRIAPERLGMPPHPPEIEREMLLYTISNHALGFGVLGLLLCGSLGLALGALRGSARAAIQGLLLGGILGLVFGAAGGIAAFLTYESLVPVPMDGMFKAMLIHFPNWLLLALTMAIVAAVQLKRPRQLGKLLSSATATAILTALLYPVLGLIFFRAAASDRPIPFETGLRMLCFAFGGAVLGLAVARWMRPVSAGSAK